MGRNVVMVHGFTRSVSRAWSLVQVVYHTATSYAMQLSMLKVVCPTPPLTPLCVDECRCGNVRACLGPRSCVKGLISFCVFTASVLLGSILEDVAVNVGEM